MVTQQQQQQQHQELGASLAHSNSASITSNSQISKSQEGAASSTVASHSHISMVTQQQQQQEQGASLAHTNNASIASISQISF
jgi:hypothetical protein